MKIEKITATPDKKAAKKAHKGNTLGVLLYGRGGPTLPGLGEHLPEQFNDGLYGPPSDKAWDFLSIALAVFAADRFVSRWDSEDGWTRVLDLDVAVIEPNVWNAQADQLAAALRFLTGDIWRLSFSEGGVKPPKFQGELHDRNAVCLFSGGLDSLLGALKLLDEGHRPLLVSQGSPKEITPQKDLASMIGMEDFRFEARVIERWEEPYEQSSRGRSIIFFAYGVAAASALGLDKVIVPENGFIAINPPLTGRRRGSLSTRTVHPHFLGEMNAILKAVGLNIALTNIFEGQSKGRMLATCKHPNIRALAQHSYSCGKGKRLNRQCGQCVPCLIRRASFAAAQMQDKTVPGYKYVDLGLRADNDDVLAARLAVTRAKKLTSDEFERWVGAAGPLPRDAIRRAAIVAAVENGIGELDSFLQGFQWR